MRISTKNRLDKLEQVHKKDVKFVVVRELPEDPVNVLWDDKVMKRKKARKRAKKKKFAVMWIKIRSVDYKGYKQFE